VAAKRKSSAPDTAPARAPKNTVAAARGRRASGGAGASRARHWWENFKSLAGTVAIFLLIRAFLVEAYRIPSESMVPALLVGDWLFVNKLRYGPHVPFTSVNLPGYAEPRRGEVAVFESPWQPDEEAIGNDPTPTLVKRIVGVAGDTLHMRGGLLHVNGIAQRQGYAAAANEKGLDSVDPLFDWQKRVALARSRFGAAPAQPTHDNWGPLVVPASHFFMMGDNRYNSKDSRYWGLVPRENIRGRPLFVYYSFDRDADRPLPFVTAIRWGRIGHRIR
jgi:signal peptidase I